MDMFDALQEFFFKTKNAKSNGGDDATEIRSFCCAGSARKRDASTSTHDLSTYVWHTEGDGVELSSSIMPDEEDRCSCRGRKQCSLGVRSQQSARCAAEGQGSVYDASTSTFGLTTYVWGTQGDMWTTNDSRVQEEMDDDGFAQDLGDKDNAGKSWGEVGRKRPRAGAAQGIIICSNNGGLAAPPRKKKRIKKD